MEDFGYQKNYDGDDRFSHILKRIFLSLAALFSVAAFIYVTVSAYNYVYEDKISEIKTVKSPKNPIKVIKEDSPRQESMRIDHKIYEDIFGTKKSSKKVKTAKIKNSPAPAIPPKKVKKPSARKTKDSQKLIVFSEIKKDKNNKDLLTKLDGDKRDNSAAKPRKSSKRKARVRVQVAAMSSNKSAQKTWRSLKRSYPTLFNNLEPFIKKVNLGKRGIFYRLQIGDFFNQVEAESFCRRYVAAAKKSKADCIIVE